MEIEAPEWLVSAIECSEMVEKLLHTGHEHRKSLFTIFIDDPIVYYCHVLAFTISIWVKGHPGDIYVGLVPAFSLGASSIAAPSLEVALMKTILSAFDA